jgi:hypothetical protein
MMHSLHLTSFKHGRVADERRTNERGVDAIVTPKGHLIVKDLIKAHHSKLGGTVVGQLAETYKTCGAGYTHNVSMLLLYHVR